MCFSSGDGGAAARARAEEEARQARIREGSMKIADTFSTFDDEFFKKRQADYENSQRPEVDRQFKEAQGNIMYGLARTGNLGSSERTRQLGVVGRERDAAALKVADKGLEYANQARAQVEQSRTDLLNQLNATSDAQLASNQAANRMNVLRASPAFEGLGSLFETSGNIAKSVRQAEYYNPGSPGWSGLNPFASSNNSGGKGGSSKWVP